MSNYNRLMNTSDIISLISRIRRNVNGLIVSELSNHGIEGLAVSHGDILYSLFRKQKMTMAEIAGRISKDKSTVTALADKLMKLGYIRKERDTEDTRVVYMTLTPKGLALEPVFMAISEKMLEIFYRGITEGERQELFRILSKIDSNFN